MHVQARLARIVILGCITHSVIVVKVGQAMVMITVMVMAKMNVIHVTVCMDMKE